MLGADAQTSVTLSLFTADTLRQGRALKGKLIGPRKQRQGELRNQAKKEAFGSANLATVTIRECAIAARFGEKCRGSDLFPVLVLS